MFPSSLSERKLDALFMAGFLPKTGNHILISANFGAKVGPLSNKPRSLRQAASYGIYVVYQSAQAEFVEMYMATHDEPAKIVCPCCQATLVIDRTTLGIL